MEYKIGQLSNNTLRDIGIGHVINNHFASKSIYQSNFLGSYDRWRQMDRRCDIKICYK